MLSNNEQRHFLRTRSHHSRFLLFYLGSLLYLAKGFLKEKELVPRPLLREILITLNKVLFSTLREISYIVNSLKIIEGDIEPKKLHEILMRDGCKRCLIQPMRKKKFHSFRRLWWRNTT